MLRRTLVLMITGVALAVAGAAAATAAVPTLFSGAIVGTHARPRTVWLSADGTLVVLDTHWRSWGGPVAIGAGTAEYHGCRPECGVTRHHFVKVIVALSDPVSCRASRYARAGRYYDAARLWLARDHRPLLAADLLPDHWAPCR